MPSWFLMLASVISRVGAMIVAPGSSGVSAVSDPSSLDSVPSRLTFR